MKRFTVTIFKTTKQREQSHEITPHHRRFWNTIRQGKFPRTFAGRLPGVVSSLDAEEPEPNKSSTHVEARITLLPHVEAEYVFLPAILTVVAVAFLATLRLEDFTTNLLLCFMSLARASSSVEVRVLESNNFLSRPCFPEVFLSAGAGAVAAGLHFYTMGSGWAGREPQPT
jgi:hypothetical protein